MSLKDEDAAIAAALGLPSYRKSPLKSKTYQVFLQVLSLFDEQAPGQETQEKEVEEAHNRLEIEEHASVSEPVRVTTDAAIEEGEISDDGAEVNLPEEEKRNEEEGHVKVSGEEREKDLWSDLLLKQVEEKKLELDRRKTCEYNDIYGDAIGMWDTGRRGKKLKVDGKTNNPRLRKVVKEKDGKLAAVSEKVVKEKDGKLAAVSEKVAKEKDGKPLVSEKVAKEKDGKSVVVSEKVAQDKDGKSASVKCDETGAKRKRVITEERRAKKKVKRRIQRAEQNKRDGVKRLKLQTIVKAKKVQDCKYYLHGKCQQGDSCKFSHDLTPLTKSEPCKFLAVQRCLRGEECPYDHQLSKYPCDNIKTKDFCSRGDTCLFSHKVPIMSPASEINKKTPCTTTTTTTRTTPVSLVKPSPPSPPPPPPPPTEAPKGISFLSFGKAAAATPSTTDHSTPQQIQKSPNDKMYCPPRTPSALSEFALKYVSKMHQPSPITTTPPTTSQSETQKMMDRSAFSMPTPAPARTTTGITTISDILQEFLFHGQ